MIKTSKQLLQNMVADIISSTDKITYFGKEGVVRGILHAASHAISEVWTDHYQIKRKIFVETSSGSDLDELAARQGLSRNQASKSSVILIFNGPANTTIPSGTVVKSNITQIEYKTTAEITLGQANPNIQRPITEYTIGDVVLAESIEVGSKTKVNPNELTQLATPITDVTVTNHAMSLGGDDEESDSEFRERIKNQISILNQGTKLFYETLAQASESTVSKARAFHNVTNLGTDIYILKDSFGTYSASELTSIASDIYNAQRAMSPVVCYNANVKGIDISFSYERDASITQESIFSSIANEVAKYIRSIIDFGAIVEFQKILNIIIDTKGVKLIPSTLKVNNVQENIACGTKEVPRLVSLAITDNQTTKQESIIQKYIRTEN